MPFDSFNTKDIDGVDDGINANLFRLMDEKKGAGVSHIDSASGVSQADSSASASGSQTDSSASASQADASASASASVSQADSSASASVSHIDSASASVSHIDSASPSDPNVPEGKDPNWDLFVAHYLGYFIVGLFCYICSFLLFVWLFFFTYASLAVVYVSHVEDMHFLIPPVCNLSK
jgi:hypothetical protein